MLQIIKKYLIFVYLLFKIILLKIRYPSVNFIRSKKIEGRLFSQDGQDHFVLPLIFKYFDSSDIRWVVDCGANDPVKFSNSYLFEKYFGCKTIAIEPLLEFQSIWATARPFAEFVPVALGSVGGETKILVPVEGDTMFSSVSGGVDKKFHSGSYEERTVKVQTLANILEQRNVTDVLLLSIDVEGFEIEVLKGIDFKKCSFRVIICENNSDGLLGNNLVRDYLIAKGYKYYARIGWNDDVFIE